MLSFLFNYFKNEAQDMLRGFYLHSSHDLACFLKVSMHIYEGKIKDIWIVMVYVSISHMLECFN